MSDAKFWDDVYSEKSLREVSWFAEELTISTELIELLAPLKTAKIIDVGAGRSFLVDGLLQTGYKSVSIFDISKEAVAQTIIRLKYRGLNIETLVGDITNYDFGLKTYDLWHDRAVFHFLTERKLRDAYKYAAKKVVKKSGHVVMATFGPDGPSRCSGLEVCKYCAEELAAELGDGFDLLGSRYEIHSTPFNTEQQFLYCWFKLV